MTNGKDKNAGVFSRSGAVPLRLVLLLFSGLLLVGCQKKGKEGQGAVGRPFEVVLVGNDDDALGAVEEALSVPCEALPQDEPAFDVVKTGKMLTPATRIYRNIVVVETDSSRYDHTLIRHEKNAFATGQLLVYVTSPSARRLSKDLDKKNADRLRNMLERNELNAAAARLNESHNAQSERMIREIMQLNMQVPEGMVRSKQGKDFVWLSDDGVEVMQNICLYSFSADAWDYRRFPDKRDSVMKANIPGEKDGMYMETVGRTVLARQQQGRLVFRGLWQMSGDMMGGPFVAHVVEHQGRIIVAEAFVFAPGHKKRNTMRQLEAALYTVTLQDQ